LRALTFVMFLALPLSWLSALAFAASLGFLWLGTVPLTSGLVGYMFGPTHLSMCGASCSSATSWAASFGSWGHRRADLGHEATLRTRQSEPSDLRPSDHRPSRNVSGTAVGDSRPHHLRFFPEKNFQFSAI